MASVWKRLQRVNKRAAKFQYTASYHRIDLETSPKWKPNKLSIVWTRRSRRVITEPLEWEPSLKDPLKGSVIYPIPENHTVAVTLFKDSRTNELEDKDWTFVLEDVSVTGKRRRLAVCAVNMRRHASLEPSQRSLVLALEPTTHKVRQASIHLTLHCVLLREGQATDEDMQSLASLLSVNNNSDIAVLEDLDEDDYTLSDNSTKQVLDFRQQMEEMTQSLTNSDVAATPNSVQSLNFDNSRTPTGPVTPELTPTTPVPKDPTPPTHDRTEPSVTTKSRPEFKYSYNMTKIAMKEGITPLPRYTPIEQTETKPDSLKAVVFKPKTIAKRNLKPLELKSNLNHTSLDSNDNNQEDVDKTPTTAIEKLIPGRLDKDKTPVQDLLEWCQGVTREYPSCRVTNLTTSFRSGLAFCAIIHRFRPDLIDFSGLQPDEAEHNVRTALDASSRLGISQVLSAADVCRNSPDRLAIMTYLFQLRAHFTGNELQVEQLGGEDVESSYLVGRHDTDGSMPRDLFSREVAERRSRNAIERPKLNRTYGSQESEGRGEKPSNEKQSPARTLLGKLVSSPPHDKPSAQWFTDITKEQSPPARPERLMTRKELTDPFGSDEEEDQPSQPQPSKHAKTEHKPTVEPATTDPLTTFSLTQQQQQHQQQQETSESQTDSQAEKQETPELPKPTPGMTEEERQAMLRERARKLIADARAGIVSPTSPTSPRAPRGGTLEIITKQSVMEEIAAAAAAEGVDRLELLSRSSHSSPHSTPGSGTGSGSVRSYVRDSDEDPNNVGVGVGGATRGSPLHSFSALVDNITLDGDEKDDDENREGGSYIQSELEALEREQHAIDERAAALEKQLRAVMESHDDTQEEDRLMSQWFNLVNKKNALIRRQMQLNILEQEEDLSRRCELLARELRLSLGVEEWRKTTGQKRRERLLLHELLAAVNRRDRLVHEMDEQEKAIAEDDEIERNLSQVEIQRKNNCILQ